MRRGAALGTVAVGAAVLLVGAGAGARQLARAASAAVCAPSQTQVWLGDGEGGGAAGHVYYPLEFSNVSHRPCALFGFPGVSAISSNGRQIGASGSRSGSSGGIVTLAVGATAHALLAIADWGAICSHGIDASGIRVYPPSQRSGQIVEFPLEVCASRGVLSVGPIRAGVGIPGYTNS
jgi:hypothetical protein